jgi:flagellar motor switch protein FliG
MAESTAIHLSGIEKASLLLIALGSKTASGILQQLDPQEVQKLCTRIAMHKNVDPNLRDAVLREVALNEQAQSSGGIDYAQELLEQSLGSSKAKEMMADIAKGSGARPFDWLTANNVSRLANCLKSERPQVITLVLAHLTSDQAAATLALLPEELQGKVAFRMTSMQPVAFEVVESIEEIVKQRMTTDGHGDRRAVGGLQSLVSILNNADRSTENKILEFLQQAESTVAENIREMMFVFEDIITLDDRSLQIVIRELEQDDLRLALKGATDEIKEAFFRNMSERAAEALKEDLEMMGPVKRRDVEAAQRRVVSVVRRLEESGDINLRTQEEDIIA